MNSLTVAREAVAAALTGVNVQVYPAWREGTIRTPAAPKAMVASLKRPRLSTVLAACATPTEDEEVRALVVGPVEHVAWVALVDADRDLETEIGRRPRPLRQLFLPIIERACEVVGG